MAEKVARIQLPRSPDRRYFVLEGKIWSVPVDDDNPIPAAPSVAAIRTFLERAGAPVLEIDAHVRMDPGFIYFVDRDGDVARATLLPSSKKWDPSKRPGQVPQPAESTEILYQLFPQLDVPKSTQAIQLIQAEATRIFNSVATGEDLGALKPRQLEELVAEVLHREGYETFLTPETRDGGRDVIAFRRERIPILLIAEAKQMRLVQPQLVLALAAARDRDKANVGLLVTTGHFSDETHEMVENSWASLIRLSDGQQFLDWIRRLKVGRR